MNKLNFVVLSSLLLVLDACAGGTRNTHQDAGPDGIEQDLRTDAGLPDVPDILEKDVDDGVPAPDVDVIEDLLPDIFADADSVEDLVEPDLVEVTKHVDKGKYWLTVAEPVFALREFQKALEVAPDNQEALFGAGLAQFINATEILGMLMSLPSQLAGYQAGDGTIADSENEYLMEVILKAFLELHSTFADAEGYFKQVNVIEGELFNIEKAPIYFTIRPILVLRGKFDAGDLYLFRSASNFGLWVTGLLAAQDFHTDLGVAVALLKDLDDGATLDKVFSIVGYLMRSDERFLSLETTKGPELFAAGSQQMMDAGAFLIKAIEYLEAHPDDVEGEVTHFAAKGSNTVIVLNNRVLLKTGEEQPQEIPFSQTLVEDQRLLLQAMDTPGTVVPFSKGPAIQLGVLIALLNSVGIIDQIPIELPVDISFLGPDQIYGLLPLFLNDALGFDYSALFANPIGLRSILPTLTGEVNGTVVNLMEWECPEEIATEGKPAGKGGIVCSDAAVLTDGPHFVGTEFELTADERPTPLPYLVFEDPTWGGFVLVDTGSSAGLPLTGEYEYADLNGFLGGLHSFIVGIMGLLQ